jgi:branched-chain amino acid transport system substrate-binding protein
MKLFWIFALSLLVTSCTTVNERPELQSKKTTKAPVTSPKVASSQNSRPSPGAPAVVNAASNQNATAQMQNLSLAQDYERKIIQLEKNGQHKESVRLCVAASVATQLPQHQDQFRFKAIDLVQTKLSPEELEEVGRGSDFGFIRAHAFYKLAQSKLEQKELESARRFFYSVTELAPGSDLASRAKESILQIDSSRQVQSQTIGVVLPLTGKSATIGQRALRGVQMGLGLHQSFSNFKLAIIDSEGSPDIAKKGVERLVLEDNAIAIIGGLLGKTANEEIAKAGEYGVPFFALSQKSGLTELGPHVFRNSLTTEMQVRELVRTAMVDLGLKKFAVLYPNDTYGVEATNLFWNEVLARGGSIEAAQVYKAGDTDFRQTVQRLVGTFYIEARNEEYKFKQKEFFENNKSKSSRLNFSPDDLLTSDVRFEAVFIPDSSKTMGQLSAFLSYAGVKNVYLMGTNLWNGPGLDKRAGHFAQQILFVDSYSPSDLKSNRFMLDYMALYKEQASVIEVQAYDSALMLRQLILQGTTRRESLISQLTQLKDFPGAIGPLSVTSDREVKRPLLSLTLDKTEIVPFKR